MDMYRVTHNFAYSNNTVAVYQATHYLRAPSFGVARASARRSLEDSCSSFGGCLTMFMGFVEEVPGVETPLPGRIRLLH